jgi:4a-hydroxytetrahydrobiopterin dehydratase
MKKRDEMTKGTRELADRDCVPCKKGQKPLKGEDLAGLLWKLDGWAIGAADRRHKIAGAAPDEGRLPDSPGASREAPRVKEHHLTKEWTFDDFAEALAFVNKVGALAEEQGHHPDLFLKWGLVRAEIYTHSIDGLAESDFVLAAKIDRLRR